MHALARVDALLRKGGGLDLKLAADRSVTSIATSERRLSSLR